MRKRRLARKPQRNRESNEHHTNRCIIVFVVGDSLLWQRALSYTLEKQLNAQPTGVRRSQGAARGVAMALTALPILLTLLEARRGLVFLREDRIDAEFQRPFDGE